MSFGLAPSGGICMHFERGKPPETPNAPYRAARIKDERWRSAGPGFELGRAGPRLSLRSSQDQKPRNGVGRCLPATMLLLMHFLGTASGRQCMNNTHKPRTVGVNMWVNMSRLMLNTAKMMLCVAINVVVRDIRRACKPKQPG
jgi:hypothetical protein